MAILKTKNEYEVLAELICDLTRNCNIKEEYFAASFHLSPSQVKVLKLFIFHEDLNSKDISELLNLSSGRVAQILNELNKKGLILKEPGIKDKRNIKLFLAPNAKPFIKNIHKSYSGLNERIIGNVSKDQYSELLNSLELLVDNFSKWVNNKYLKD